MTQKQQGRLDGFFKPVAPKVDESSSSKKRKGDDDKKAAKGKKAKSNAPAKRKS